MLIYKLTNTVTNKIYIGQTINSWKKRKNNYNACVNQEDNNQPIINSLRKHGWDNFAVEILHEDVQSWDELNKLEKEYIEFYNSTNPEKGYNLSDGGAIPVGKRVRESLRKAWTPERRHAQSEKMKVQNELTRETRSKNISESLKKRYSWYKHTDEFKEKNKKLQEGKKEYRKNNPVVAIGKYILENKAGDQIEIINLTKWCKDNNVDQANILGNYKRKKGWAKGWRILEKLGVKGVNSR